MVARVKRVCSSGNGAECRYDRDCPSGETCVPTCDCVTDTTCEISGPVHSSVCLGSLVDCSADRCVVSGVTTALVCETDADCDGGTCTGSVICAPGELCVVPLGPPQPLAVSGVPICVVTHFDGPLTGSANPALGTGSLAASLRSRIHVGNGGMDRPCPVCGAPGDDPRVGEVRNCDGGRFHGSPCTVEGVTEPFGGTSSDCPPLASQLASNLSLRIREVTTGTTTRTAGLPCTFFGFWGNPLVSGSDPRCLDTQEPCASNADCMRCDSNPAVACGSNADCIGWGGVCSEAPSQPVTCGHWCHCGLCDGLPDLPCFGDDDCSSEQQCVVGAGSGTQATAPQSKPNDCAQDGFVCGTEQSERCEATLSGTCSLKPHASCGEDVDCAEFDAGVCLIEGKRCFEPWISRTGKPSPLASYCALEDRSCSSNADCVEDGDFCVHSSARPSTAALLCTSGTASASVNSSVGLAGPVALRLNSLLKVCYCGDGEIGCDETCDDGNVNSGDGCDELCQTE